MKGELFAPHRLLGDMEVPVEEQKIEQALGLHLYAHLAGRSRDDFDRSGLSARVEVFHFSLGDFSDLFLREFSHFGLVGLFGARSEIQRLFDQNGGRGLLCDEGKALVFKDRDHHRKDVTSLLLGRGVELLAKGHDVHAVLSQSRPDRRCRISSSSRDLEFDSCNNFFSHGCLR